MKIKKSKLLQFTAFLMFISSFNLIYFSKAFAATEFETTIIEDGSGDFTSLKAWETTISPGTASTIRTNLVNGKTSSWDTQVGTDISPGTAVTWSGGSGTLVYMTNRNKSGHDTFFIDYITGTISDNDVVTDGTNSFAVNGIPDSVIAVAKIDGAWTAPDTQGVIIDGWTTSASNYVKIYTTLKARHNGVWNTGKYILSNNTGSPIFINMSHLKIIGLQINVLRNGTANGIRNNTGGNISISHNIIKGIPTKSHFGISQSSSSTLAYIFNNIIYDCDTGIKNYNSGSAYIYNNTIYNSKTGIVSPVDNTILAKNNIIANASVSAATGVFKSGSGYNATTESSFTYTGGSNDLTGQTFTFLNETGDDFHLSPSDKGARDLGANLLTDPYIAFGNDINLQSRGTKWSIGADEYVSPKLSVSGTVSPIVVSAGGGWSALNFKLTFTNASGGLDDVRRGGVTGTWGLTDLLSSTQEGLLADTGTGASTVTLLQNSPSEVIVQNVRGTVTETYHIYPTGTIVIDAAGAVSMNINASFTNRTVFANADTTGYVGIVDLIGTATSVQTDFSTPDNPTIMAGTKISDRRFDYGTGDGFEEGHGVYPVSSAAGNAAVNFNGHINERNKPKLLLEDYYPTTRSSATLTLHSKLDSSSDVTSPSKGTGGSLIGTPPFSKGLRGSALASNANDKYVKFPGTTSGNISLVKGTLSFWFYTASDSFVANGSSRNLVGLGDAYDNAMRISYQSGSYGTLEFNIIGDAKVLHRYRIDTVLTALRWYHISFSWDSTVLTGKKNMWVFIDGKEADYAISSGTTGPFPINHTNISSVRNIINIGAQSSLYYAYNYKIDDFRIYDDVVIPTGHTVFHSKMDSAGDIANPQVGSQAGSVTGATFVSAMSGKGALFDLDGENISLTSANILTDWSKGTVEFWYNPSYKFSSPQTQAKYLFGSAASGTSNSIWARVFDNVAEATIEFGIKGAANTSLVTITETQDTLWNANEWVHLRFMWDDTKINNVCSIFVNGKYVTQTNVDTVSAMSSLGTNLYIGDYRTSGTDNSAGIIDDFLIYDGVILPYGAFNVPAAWGDTAGKPDPSVLVYWNGENAAKDAGEIWTGTMESFLNFDFTSDTGLDGNPVGKFGPWPVSRYIRLPAKGNIDPARGSVGVWFRTSTGNNRYLFMVRNGDLGSSSSPDTMIKAYINNTTPARVIFMTNIPVSGNHFAVLNNASFLYDGKWHYCHFKWDIYTGNYGFSCDGRKSTTVGDPLNKAISLGKNSYLYIGTPGATASSFIAGNIDEFYVTNNPDSVFVPTVDGLPVRQPGLSMPTAYRMDIGNDFSGASGSFIKEPFTDYSLSGLNSGSRYLLQLNSDITTSGSPIISSLSAQQDEMAGTVTISYTGKDEDGDTVTYLTTAGSGCEYSLDSTDGTNGTWSAMATSEATESFTSSGALLSYVWNADTDTGIHDDNVYVRLKVNDGENSSLHVSGPVTGGIDTLPPTGLSTLTVSNITNTSVDLSWGAATDDHWANNAHYEIRYDLATNSANVDNRTGGTVINKSLISTLTAGITGLTPRKNYYFRVWAIDQYNNVLQGPSATAVTNRAPVSGYVSDNLINASQSVSGDGVVTVSFRIKDLDLDVCTLNTFEYSLDGGLTFNAPAGGDSSLSLSSSWTDNSYLASSDLNGTVYTFTFNTKHVDLTGLNSVEQSDIQVRFKVSDGLLSGTLSGKTANFIVDNKNPAFSGSLTFTSVGNTTTTANWTQATDDYFNRYEVWYKTTSGVTDGAPSTKSGANITDVSSISRITSSLTQNTDYYFNVWAVDNYGNKTNLTEISSKTTGFKFTAPVTGTIWAAGTVQTVSWTSNNMTAPFTVQYLDGGTWNNVLDSSGTPAVNVSGTSQEWKLPGNITASSATKVKIFENSSPGVNFKESNAFTTTGNIVVNAPATSSKWAIGNAHTIKWTLTGSFANVNLEYFDGSAWRPITDGTGISGTLVSINPDSSVTKSFSWIPSGEALISTGFTTANIRVSDASNISTNNTSGSFTISDITVNFTPPDRSNSAVKVGAASQNISWTQTGVNYLKLQYYSNISGAYKDIIGAASLSSGSGSFSWTVPNDVGVNNVNIKAIAVGLDGTEAASGIEGSVNDILNSSFTLYGDLTLTSTYGGTASYQADTSTDRVPLTWTGSSSISSVVFEYTQNSSSPSYSVISPSSIFTTPTGSIAGYNWSSGSGSAYWQPSVTGNTFWFRLKDGNDSSTVSPLGSAGDYFAVTGVSITSLSVSSPYTTGESVTINGTGVSGNVVKLYYSSSLIDAKNKTGSSTLIGTSVVNGSGQFTRAWTVPDLIGAAVYIRVEDASVYNTAGPYTIKGKVTVTNPVDTDWIVGETTNDISGTVKGDIDLITLQYTIDNGSTWANLTTSPVNIGNNSGTLSSSWTLTDAFTVPDKISSSFKLRAIDGTSGRASVLIGKSPPITNSVTVRGILSITTPSAFVVGKNETINWTATGSLGNVKLYYKYSIDNSTYNAAWIPVDSGTPKASGGNAITAKAGSHTWSAVSDIVDILISGDQQASGTYSNVYMKIKLTDADDESNVLSESLGFVVKYYKVKWIVKDSNGAIITGVNSSEGLTTTPNKPIWSASGQTFGGTGTSIRYYPYNAKTGDQAYNTSFDRIESSVQYTVSKDAWTAFSDNQTFNLVLDTAATAAIASEVNIRVNYDDTSDALNMTVWLTKKGVIMTDLSTVSGDAVSVSLYDSGTLLTSTAATGSTLDTANGLFYGIVYDPTAGLDVNKIYTVKAKVTYNGKSFKGLTTYSIPAIGTYEVMIDTAYNASNDSIIVNTWLARSGTTIANPGNLTLSYTGSSGTTCPDQSVNSATAGADGVFSNQECDPSGSLLDSTLYTVTAKIVYRSSTYTGTATFSKSDGVTAAEMSTKLTANNSSLLSGFNSQLETSESDIISGVGANVKTKFDNQTTSLKTALGDIETKIKKNIDTVLTSLEEDIRDIGDVSTETDVISGIINRETTVKLGDSINIRYQTKSGVTPLISVYDGSNSLRISGMNMPLKTTVAGTNSSIYEYSLAVSSSWGEGEYLVVCTNGIGNMDSISISVTGTNLEDIKGVVSSGSADSSLLISLSEKMELLTAKIEQLESNEADTDTDYNSDKEDLLDLDIIAKNNEQTLLKLNEIYELMANMKKTVDNTEVSKENELTGLFELAADSADNMEYLKAKAKEMQALIELNYQMSDLIVNKATVKTWYVKE